MVHPQSRPARLPLSKRIFDVVVSSLVLVIFSPAMAILALLVRLTLGSPVIFSQPRPGFKGKIFTLYKFRSMSNEKDPSGRPLADTQRVTPLGRLLRSTSLDELPEFYNVLRGEMSIVGPRPLLAEYLPRYTAEQRRRHDVLPGISGWAQVNGRNAISWEQKFELDVWYVDHWSFGLDLKIIWMTVWQVLRRRDITPPGQASMGEFQG